MSRAPDRVLVFAAHQDDETIGCGGTIRKWANSGTEVHVCFVTDSSYWALYDENHSRKMSRDDISGGDYHALKEKVIENYKRAGIPLYWW